MANGNTRIVKKQENTVWLRQMDTFEPAQWAGQCTRIEDIVKPKAGVNPTYCQNPREGGVQISGYIKDLPGLPTSSIVMKESLYDVLSDDIENCLWYFDRRTHCRDLDDWTKWEKIRRICGGFVTERTDMGSTFDETDEDNMTTHAITGIGDVTTIRRVAATIQTSPESVAARWLDVDVCHGERCASRCDSEDECVVAAVTELIVAGSPHLLVNNNGGNAGYWTDYELTEWTASDAVAVLCLGDFLLIASDGTAPDNEFLRSYDQGVTRQEITGNADMVAGNVVTCMDAITQNTIVAGASSGYVYKSTDSGSTWITVDPGVATTQDLAKIKIARDNPSIMYAIGASNALIKSENGGDNWFALTGPSAADNLTALWLASENRLLIGNDDGELWESLDGGETWTQQTIDIPVTPGAGTTTIADIDSCGCDVVWLIVKDSSVTSFSQDTEQYLFRNVDGGASDRWYLPQNGTLALTSGQTPEALACCGTNRVIAVGGATGASGMVAVAA